MAKLAIIGHKTRGKEVIKILEMLGGENQSQLKGIDNSLVYHICTDGYIVTLTAVPSKAYKFFTIEEFFEKYPYKFGDRVRIPEYESEVCISKMHWDGNEVQYEVVTDEVEWYSAAELNRYNAPYKKQETMEEGVYAYNEINCYHQDFSDKVRIKLGRDYEIKVEEGKTYIVRKKPQYPKTYVECCKVVNASPYINLVYDLRNGQRYSYDVDNLQLYENFRRLRICRDAYWKVAGEEMGLDKPWEPYIGKSHIKYVIQTVYDKITCLDTWCQTKNILEFPTPEMRDTFYDNFKDLFESCKELL